MLENIHHYQGYVRGIEILDYQDSIDKQEVLFVVNCNTN
jgi:hypothetical protein